MTWRGGLRGAYAMALRWRARLSGRRLGIALLYHELAEHPGDPATALSCPHGREAFRAQLRHIRRAYRAVPASQLQEAAARRRRGERIPIAITFDDDPLSHAAIAAPELRAAGLPATFFLTGAGLDGPGEFWWHPAQRLADAGGLSDGASVARELGLAWEPEPGERPLWTLARGLELATPEVRRRATARLVDLAGPGDRASMDAAALRALAASGFEIGWHTREHARMDRLDAGERARAVSDGRDALVAATGVAPRTFAYPHGGCDPESAAAVRAAGHDSGYTTRKDVVRPGDDPMRLGRFTATYLPVSHFKLDLAQVSLR